jgi:hypothetical protein
MPMNTNSRPSHLLGRLLIIFAGVIGTCSPALAENIKWDAEQIVVPLANGQKLASTKFRGRNISGNKIEILRVSTSCGCTSAKASQIFIKPGGTIEIPVQVKMELSNNRNVAQIVVMTRQGEGLVETPDVLTLIGVRPPHATPSKVFLSWTAKEGEIEKSIEVSLSPDADNVVSLAQTKPNYDVKVINGSKNHQVTISVKPITSDEGTSFLGFDVYNGKIRVDQFYLVASMEAEKGGRHL